MTTRQTILSLALLLSALSYGQVHRPGVEVTSAARKLLPARAVVRRTVRIGQSSHDVSGIVYDLAPGPLGFHPHIAIIERGRLAASFNLEKLDEFGDQSMFLDSRPIETSDGSEGFIAAFQAAADGAGNLFAAVIKPIAPVAKWQMAFLKRETQARLTILEDGRVLKSLSADEQGECTWCSHTYIEEIFTLDPRTARYQRTAKIEKPRKMDPFKVTKLVLALQ